MEIENLNIHYVSKDKFDIGIIEIESPYSNPIKYTMQNVVFAIY